MTEQIISANYLVGLRLDYVCCTYYLHLQLGAFGSLRLYFTRHNMMLYIRGLIECHNNITQLATEKYNSLYMIIKK